MKFFYFILISLYLAPQWLYGDISVEGNARVEKEAIINLMKSKDTWTKETIRQDILAIYKLGYFSKVGIYEDKGNLIVSVQEKPAISEIRLEGFKEISEEDIKKVLETKIYQIVNDGSIASDIGKIEKKYQEKGFFLAQATHVLEKKNDQEVAVVFKMDEGGKVLVGDVHILGRNYFSLVDLLDKMALRPYSRTSALGSSSIYQSERLGRDTEFLEYYYKDFGFADAKVAQPAVFMDTDKRFVRITFQIEEGLQYRVGQVSFSKDIGEHLYTEKELAEDRLLQKGELFRYSYFSQDIEHLAELYGDLGYAYADINPITTFHKDTQTVDINYEITKGEKIYFGSILIAGNTKTRDNVIRRELEVFDSELYSGSKMTATKDNIQRLGYFDEVQILKERDAGSPENLNLKIKVKEKSTGSFNASLGYAPGGDTSAKAFGQGRYEEKNQSGFGWTTSLALKFSSKTNYEVDTGFSNPRINDSQWSLGVYYSHQIQETRYGAGLEIPERRQTVSVTLGRDLFELVRGYVTLRHSVIKSLESTGTKNSQADLYALFDDFQSDGKKNSITLALSRKKLDNYLDPTKGTSVTLQETFTGMGLGGDYHFRESSLEGDWYIPLNFIEDFKTYLKFHGSFSKLWKASNRPIPSSERYRLGGYNTLRGFDFWELGPYEKRLRSPTGSSLDFNLGGNRQLYFQSEYFLPLIPQAGIKFVLFWDTGRVYREDDPFSLSQMEHDVGFGFRWITPFGPFRFEWATPYDKKKKSFGDMKFIFNIGY